MNNLKKYFQLTRQDQWLLVCFVFKLTLIDLGLRFLGFQKLLSYLTSRAQNKSLHLQGEEEDLVEVRHTAVLVEIAANHGFFKATCLRQALLVYYLLLKKGIKTELRIGINDETRIFSAHAWIKYKDEVILGGQLSESNYSLIY